MNLLPPTHSLVIHEITDRQAREIQERLARKKGPVTFILGERRITVPNGITQKGMDNDVELPQGARMTVLPRARPPIDKLMALGLSSWSPSAVVFATMSAIPGEVDA